MKQRYKTPWWASARDMELLEGRVRAEATWGTGYYRDDPSSEGMSSAIAGRVESEERDIAQLYALAAMRPAEVAEISQRRHKPRY